MRAFVCVYRHAIPNKNEWNRTQKTSATDPVLTRFLSAYHAPSNYYDWGDDPGFFAAEHYFGTPLLASWGVCRRNVRNHLDRNDFVLWFCGKQDQDDKKVWNYYFIGCTTVAEKITRTQLWSQPQYLPYRSFYNVLVRPANGELIQHETFHSYHDDWKARSAAPYILFDATTDLSALNLTNPLLVATKPENSLREIWHSNTSLRVRQIETNIFSNLGIIRRLRTTNPYIPHAPIALHNQPGSTVKKLNALRDSILPLV
jgi:hypothetical protein